MTDDLMDARLRAAGESWRSANTTPAGVSSEPAEELHLGSPRPRRTHWLTIASAAIVAAALVVGGLVLANGGGRNGGKPVATERSDALTAQSWVLTDNQAMLTFHAGAVTVDDGCNVITRRVQIAGDTITFGTVAKAQGCVQPSERVNQIENILTGTVRWSIQGGKLTLTQSASATVSGTLEFETSQAAVIGTPWQLVSFVDDTGKQHVINPEASITISAKQRLVGSDGCNTMSGPVQVHADTIDFGGLATTEMACSAAAGSTTYVDSMLTGTAGYTISGGELIVTKSGVGSLTFGAKQAADVSDLVGVTWRLTGTQVSTTSGKGSSGSGRSAASQVTLSFDGNGGYTVEHSCSTDKGKIVLGAGTADINFPPTVVEHRCPTNPPPAAVSQDSFVDAMFRGQLTWSIDGSELTITKDDRLSATFAAVTGIDALVSSKWTLTSIAHGTGSSGSVSTAPAVVFQIGRESASDSGDNAVGVALTSRTIKFMTSWANGLVLGTGPSLGATDSVFVYGKLLVGTVNWSITDGQLTITKQGVGALVFTKKS